MEKSILALPPELLEAISSFLDANDLQNFGLSCKVMLGLLSNDLIWQKLIARRFLIKVHQYPESSARAFYKHILRPYAPIIGFWQMEFESAYDGYGGLMRVFLENGCLIGQQIVPSHSIIQPLDSKRIFKIQLKMDADGGDEEVKQDINLTCGGSTAKSISAVHVPETTCLCLLGTDETPSLGCNKSKSMLIIHKPEDCLEIRCNDPESHRARMGNCKQRNSHLSIWEGQDFACESSRISFDTGIPEVAPFTSILPAPGFFVCRYGEDRNEIAVFRYRPQVLYSEGGSRDVLEGFYATGSVETVPTREISMRVFLDKPLCPKTVRRSSADDCGQLGQPFYLPNDVEYEGDSELIPKHFLAKFEGEMMLEAGGCGGESWSETEVVIFGQDLLGLICYELEGFMLFKRVGIGGAELASV